MRALVGNGVAAQPAAAGRQIAWGAKVSPEFKAKVVAISAALGVNPSYLMACMAFESGQTFSADVKNGKGSGAVGLIQFMPSTAAGLGTTTSALAAMTPEQQLDYVKKYFMPFQGRLHTLLDVYMAIFTPAGIGKPGDYVLYSEGKKAYTQNKGFDSNNDGKITIEEISTTVQRAYQKGLSPTNMG